MEHNSVEVEVLIPHDLLPAIEQYAKEHAGETQLECEPIMPDVRRGEQLNFEPITGAVIGWVVLKFVGGVAAKVAADVITKLVAEKLKARWPDQPNPQLKVRLTTAEQLSLDLKQPLDENQLAEKLKESSAE